MSHAAISCLAPMFAIPSSIFYSISVKITVAVKPNSKKESVERLADGSYLIRVNAPPTEGRANQRVIELLSETLNRPKTSFDLISGHKSKKKVFKVG